MSKNDNLRNLVLNNIAHKEYDKLFNEIESIEKRAYVLNKAVDRLIELNEQEKNSDTSEANLITPVVSNNEVELKTFVSEFIESWDDGTLGDSYLYRKAKRLL